MVDDIAKVRKDCLTHNHPLRPTSEIQIRPCHLTNQERQCIIDLRGLEPNLSRVREKVIEMMKERFGFEKLQLVPGFFKNLKPKTSSLPDALQVDDFLKQQQKDNPKFHYNAMIDANQLQRLFMMTDDQQELIKMNHDVIFVDATYKVTYYDYKLVHFAIIDYNGNMRIVASGYILTEKEEDYAWIFRQFQEATRCSPRVFIIDQGTSLPGAFKEVFPSSKIINCLFHIQNNLPKYMKGMKDEDKRTFDLDFHSWIGSASSKSFESKYQALRAKYHRFPEMILHLMKLHESKDKFAYYVRRRESSFHFSSSVAEIAHAIFKRKCQGPVSLIKAVKASFEIAADQKNKQIFCENNNIFTCRQKYTGTQKELFKKIIDSVENQFGKFANDWLCEEIGHQQACHLQARLNAKEFDKFVHHSTTDSGKLPSDGQFRCEIPEDVIDAAAKKECLIFLITEEDTSEFKDREKFTLARDEAILVYTMDSFEFRCSCQVSAMKGVVCRHFLTAYRHDPRVFYNPSMWAERWSKCTPVDNKVVNVKGKTIEIPSKDPNTQPVKRDKQETPSIIFEEEFEGIKTDWEYISASLLEARDALEARRVRNSVKSIRHHLKVVPHKQLLSRAQIPTKKVRSPKLKPSGLYVTSRKLLFANK